MRSLLILAAERRVEPARRAGRAARDRVAPPALRAVALHLSI